MTYIYIFVAKNLYIYIYFLNQLNPFIVLKVENINKINTQKKKN